MPLTWVDIFLVVMMCLSGFLAMLRGLTREVLSIASWALAALATLYLWPIYKDDARALIPDPPILGEVLLAAGIFLFVLIVSSLFTVKISDRFLDSRIGVLDRTLGFAFGLGRGLILVSILYLFFAWLIPKENMPVEVQEARTLPLIEGTGNAIVSLLPENAAESIHKRLEEKAPDDKKSGLMPGNNFAGSLLDTKSYRSELNKIAEVLSGH